MSSFAVVFFHFFFFFTCTIFVSLSASPASMVQVFSLPWIRPINPKRVKPKEALKDTQYASDAKS